MAHLSQQLWLIVQRSIHPDYFKKVNVIDIGSANINGTNRYLFKDCDYFGYDTWLGPNVTNIGAGKYITQTAHTVICTEVLEHDPDWPVTFWNMARIAQKCLIMTCATTGRPEHGTERTTPAGSPFKGITHYRNLTREDLEPVIKRMFRTYKFVTYKTDLYFIGFKGVRISDPNLLTFLRLYTYRFILNRIHDYRQALKKIGL